MRWWTLEFLVVQDFAESASWLIAEALDHPVEIKESSNAPASFRLLSISFDEEPPPSVDETIYASVAALGLQEPHIERTTSDDRSWQDGWKDFFHTTLISPRFAVRPPWEDDGDVEHTIIIEPGLAFGTGTHPTTAGCLNMLDRVLGSKPKLRVLDVGCGSAILSIAASLLGHDVVGIDIDEDAVGNARQNCLLNGVNAMVDLRVLGPESIHETFNLVVANIIAPILVENAPAIKGCAENHLILSGLLAHQEAEILDAYKPWMMQDRTSVGDWVILHLVKQA